MSEDFNRLTRLQQVRAALELDFLGETSRLLTPAEILFTRKWLLRRSYFWLAAGSVATLLVGLGLDWKSGLLGLVVFAAVCIGYPMGRILKERADLADGKAATAVGPIQKKKISQTSRMFIEVDIGNVYLGPVSLQLVKAAYEQLSEQENVSVDYLPRTRVALRVSRQGQENPLWAADPAIPARWFR